MENTINCSALNQDLAKILTLQEEIDILWLQTEQTGIASVVLREKLDQLNILQDKLLEANLENFSGLYPDFAEQFKIKVEYGAEIEGFGNKNINSTLQLDPNTVLVTGDFGETRLLSKQTDGSWHYGAEISGFGDKIITSTLQLDPNTVLVTGAGGKTRLLSKQTNGAWHYGTEISGFSDNHYDGINSTLQLDPNTVLVTGDFGETRLLSKQTDGSWHYGAEISGFSDRIYSTLQLDPNTVLATGFYGATCLLKITKPDITLDMLKGHLKNKAI